MSEEAVETWGQVPDVTDDVLGHEKGDAETTDAEVSEAVGNGERAEPDVDEVELSADDFGGDDLFSDIEDSDDSEGKKPDPLGDLEDVSGGLSRSVNEGAARLAVVGLEDAEDLQDEFLGVFETFRLGYYAERVAEEYLAVGDEQIDPAWGLLGSLLCCTALALTLRPDGDEKVAALRAAVGRIAGGGA